jgi:hypothetical protein
VRLTQHGKRIDIGTRRHMAVLEHLVVSDTGAGGGQSSAQLKCRAYATLLPAARRAAPLARNG